MLDKTVTTGLVVVVVVAVIVVGLCWTVVFFWFMFVFEGIVVVVFFCINDRVYCCFVLNPIQKVPKNCKIKKVKFFEVRIIFLLYF